MEKIIEPAKVLAVLDALVRRRELRPAEANVYRLRTRDPSFPLEKMAQLGIEGEDDVNSIFARVESRYNDWVDASQGPGGSDS